MLELNLKNFVNFGPGCSTYSLFRRFRLRYQDDYLKSMWITFIASVIIRGPWGSSKNWLELKIKQP